MCTGYRISVALLGQVRIELKAMEQMSISLECLVGTGSKEKRLIL